jgi:hypothetical protein
MKLYLVLNKCGEGATFDSKRDARSALTGNFVGVYSSLAEAFHEVYPEGNRMIEIEVPDAAAT